MNHWVPPVGESAQESTKHLKSITRADKRLLSTYMHLIGSLEIVELGKRAIDMDFVATADSSAGTSVYEEDNLADKVDLVRHTRRGHFLIIKAASLYLFGLVRLASLTLLVFSKLLALPRLPV